MITHGNDDLASLRLALASAERARDDALRDAAAARARWQEERIEEQYRLRNLFTVIRAVTRRTGDDVDTVEDYCGLLDGRLSAYLNVQAMVMQDWHGGADLALLLSSVLETFVLREGEHVHFDGPSVRLTSAAAGLLALAFHELAIQVISVNRINGPDRTLQIHWRFDDDSPERTLSIDWIEQSLDVEGETSTWADWVEQAIEYQLRGSLRIDVQGSTRSIRVCLPGSAVC